MSARLRTAALLSATVVALAGCDNPMSDDPAPASGPTRGDGDGRQPGSGDPTASPTTSPASPTPASETVTVPVYFVGDTPQGPRLYREFRRVAGDDPAGAAAALMASGDALDPDYGTLYPGGSFAGVEIGDAAIVVTLADDGWTTRAAGMSASDAQLAVQQLVYTLQGVAQARLPVEVQLDGQPAALFGVATEAGVGNAPETDVRALVNVTTPEQGASASGSFTATGVASSFEATVPWEVRRGDTVVVRGFATAEGWADRLYPWEAEVDLSGLGPGRYTFVASTDDPSGGEGAGPTTDSKEFTIG